MAEIPRKQVIAQHMAQKLIARIERDVNEDIIPMSTGVYSYDRLEDRLKAIPNPQIVNYDDSIFYDLVKDQKDVPPLKCQTCEIDFSHRNKPQKCGFCGAWRCENCLSIRKRLHPRLKNQNDTRYSICCACDRKFLLLQLHHGYVEHRRLIQKAIQTLQTDCDRIEREEKQLKEKDYKTFIEPRIKNISTIDKLKKVKKQLLTQIQDRKKHILQAKQVQQQLQITIRNKQIQKKQKNEESKIKAQQARQKKIEQQRIIKQNQYQRIRKEEEQQKAKQNQRVMIEERERQLKQQRETQDSEKERQREKQQQLQRQSLQQILYLEREQIMKLERHQKQLQETIRAEEIRKQNQEIERETHQKQQRQQIQRLRIQDQKLQAMNSQLLKSQINESDYPTETVQQPSDETFSQKVSDHQQQNEERVETENMVDQQFGEEQSQAQISQQKIINNFSRESVQSNTYDQSAQILGVFKDCCSNGAVPQRSVSQDKRLYDYYRTSSIVDESNYGGSFYQNQQNRNKYQQTMQKNRANQGYRFPQESPSDKYSDDQVQNQLQLIKKDEEQKRMEKACQQQQLRRIILQNDLKDKKEELRITKEQILRGSKQLTNYTGQQQSAQVHDTKSKCNCVIY